VFRAALVILGKDLRLRLRDRSVLLYAFVVPLGLIVLFSSILPEPEELSLTAAVVDADGGDVARGFVDGVLPALVEAGTLELVEVADEAAARRAVTAGELDAAWVLPVGFSEDVGAGRPSELVVVVAAGRFLPGEIARGVAEAYATQVRQVGLAVATTATVSRAAPGPQDIAAAAQIAATTPPVLQLENEASSAGGGLLDPTSYLAAGMAAFFVFFVVQFGITGLLEERQQGTMPRLLAAPIPPAATQLGKISGAFVLGLVSMTVLAIASSLLLGADWGPAPGVAVLVVALVLAAMGVLALVGTFARTAEQAGNLQAVVGIVLGLLGGVFFPVPGDAELLRTASLISPHGWFLRGIAELRASGDWMVVWPAAGAIVAFGLVTALPAALRQRRAATW
jgi:ABC-2 type transport system permease protein